MKPSEILRIAAAAFALIAALLLLVRALRRRPSAEELERRRREEVNRKGKLGDGEILDVEGIAVIYSYQVAGVGYEAAQDVSALESLLPSDLMSMIGPVSVKFDPRNPANSIVLSEHWSGLRV